MCMAMCGACAELCVHVHCYVCTAMHVQLCNQCTCSFTFYLHFPLFYPHFPLFYPHFPHFPHSPPHQVPPMPPARVAEVLQKELGGVPLDAVFEWIDLEQPLGSASIAQVSFERGGGGRGVLGGFLGGGGGGRGGHWVVCWGAAVCVLCMLCILCILGNGGCMHVYNTHHSLACTPRTTHHVRHTPYGTLHTTHTTP